MEKQSKITRRAIDTGTGFPVARWTSRTATRDDPLSVDHHPLLRYSRTRAPLTVHSPSHRSTIPQFHRSIRSEEWNASKQEGSTAIAPLFLGDHAQNACVPVWNPRPSSHRPTDPRGSTVAPPCSHPQTHGQSLPPANGISRTQRTRIPFPLCFPGLRFAVPQQNPPTEQSTHRPSPTTATTAATAIY